MVSEQVVMVIEDDDNMRMLIKHFLERDQLDIIEKKDGKEAAEYINNHVSPDLVLVDLYLPYKDGFELIKLIRADEDGWADTPIIMISAEDTDRSVEEALDLGANDYIEKPIETKKALARIKRFL